jgi:putative polyketide hydroxylase
MSPGTSSHESEIEVLVVGAGPVGLSLGLQFARAGVRALIVERRPSLSRHPKANGIFARTMEAFRQWGIAQEVAARGLPRELCLGFVWVTRINGVELGRVMFAETAEDLRKVYSQQSPETPCFTPQDRIEQLLADEIGKDTSVALHFGTEAVAIEQDSSGARVTLQRVDGRRHIVQARYVVGADGSRSSVKALLNLREESAEPWGESVNIYFESHEFDALRAGRPYQLWWVINADVRGAFWPVSHRYRWIFTPEGVPGAKAEYYTPAVCTDLIRKGAGADVNVEVLSAMLWQHEMGIATQWREGCVFLAGDAAHRFPPHGGFGMNSGIQDAQNLGWKLIAVLRGGAGSSLLDTYEAERKPVALSNAAQTVRNAEMVKETGWFVPDPSELAMIERPEGQGVRDRIAAAVPRQAASVHSQGQQFGAIYISGAIVGDGTVPAASSVADYRPSASPGARAPHIWIQKGDTAVSILDLFRLDRLVLLVGEHGDSWRRAAAHLGFKISVFSIGLHATDYRSGEFTAVYEIEADGAVLVRPDGYVGWRCMRMSDDPERTLNAAVGQILGIP